MTDIAVDVVLAAGASEVWAKLSRIEDHVSWMHDAVSITFRSEQRRGVGTTFNCLTRLGPFHTSDVMTITRWDEGSTMGVTHQGVVTGHGEFSLAPSSAGTRLTWRETLLFPWWMGGAWGAVAARPILRWVWRRNLESLRDALVD